MSLNDPADASRETFRQAFDALSKPALDRIARHAKEKAAYLGLDPQDLIHEAIVCFIRGNRKWAPEDLEKSFHDVVNSISWNLYVSQKSRTNREHRYTESRAESPSADDWIELEQRIRSLLRHFDADEHATRLMRAMLKHASAKLAAESLGYTPQQAEAILRRIRRQMRALCSKKKK